MPATAEKNGISKRTRRLIENLVVALGRSGSSQGEPLIIESRIAQTKSVHIVVIWDAWEGLTPIERSKVILDAYAKAKRLRNLTITVAMGLTAADAHRMGFLPYSIVTTRRQNDKASVEELSKAMTRAGGILMTVGSSAQLRFPTLEQAEDAYRLLSQEVPGPYWAIVEDQHTSD